MFRYKRGIRLSYARQGYIYFTSLHYSALSEQQQETIRRLCIDAGGVNSEALFEFVTTEKTATEICIRHFIASRTTLYRAAAKYYLSFPKQV